IFAVPHAGILAFIFVVSALARLFGGLTRFSSSWSGSQLGDLCYSVDLQRRFWINGFSADLRVTSNVYNRDVVPEPTSFLALSQKRSQKV
ncbi:hypothetical protein DMA11_25525, partial [Marinilabiliaceae bacterium JC017]